MTNDNIILKTADGAEVRLSDFLGALTKWVNDYEVTHYSATELTTFTVDPGRKFIKIVANRWGSRSVYCFLDYQGNIYKSASWKAAAKHIRGTIFQDNFSLGQALGPYGAAYLR